MFRQNLILGKSGEEAAAGFLKEKGYKILKKNYKTKLGEIDIVALDKDTLCFVEVKTRNSLRFGAPKEAVSGFKQRQICKAALSYLKENNNFDKKARFDVVSVTYFEDSPKFDLIQNAFDLGGGFIY
ncbi:MAG: YraN family protein [Candidatus Omnitrophota bacterium]